MSHDPSHEIKGVTSEVSVVLVESARTLCNRLLRQTYSRRHAFRAELTRALESLGVVPGG